MSHEEINCGCVSLSLVVLAIYVFWDTHRRQTNKQPNKQINASWYLSQSVVWNRNEKGVDCSRLLFETFINCLVLRRMNTWQVNSWLQQTASTFCNDIFPQNELKNKMSCHNDEGIHKDEIVDLPNKIASFRVIYCVITFYWHPQTIPFVPLWLWHVANVSGTIPFFQPRWWKMKLEIVSRKSCLHPLLKTSAFRARYPLPPPTSGC